MYAITVQLLVKKEKVGEFLRLTLENATNARKEPGCLRFDVLRSEKEPERFCFYEVYHDTDGHKAHQATEHYQRWRDGAGDLLAEPRTSGRWINVSPLDAEWT